MKGDFLEIDVRLLVLRYGRQKVIGVLARMGEQTPERLEQQLQDLEKKPKAVSGQKPKLSLTDIAALESRDRPDISQLLRTLAVNFENRTFLPNLRDVLRFFEWRGGQASKLKSRTVAGPILIRALSKLPREELLKLTSQVGAPGESDYSLLSRAILGTSATGPSDQE